MNKCYECIYDNDGICQNDKNSLDIEGNCLDFESRETYNSGYEKGKADGISQCLEIVQKIKDEHIDSNFIYPINYGTLCGIIIELEQLKNG